MDPVLYTYIFESLENDTVESKRNVTYSDRSYKSKINFIFSFRVPRKRIASPCTNSLNAILPEPSLSMTSNSRSTRMLLVLSEEEEQKKKKEEELKFKS
jgi:hypothetical protein